MNVYHVATGGWVIYLSLAASWAVVFLVPGIAFACVLSFLLSLRRK